MRRSLSAVAVLLAFAGAVRAHGLLIPEDKKLPPLAMLNHKVTIAIDDQVALTRVEQTFRNHTDRPLEATYIFPVPKGASVNRFTMWVNGTETKGELIEAKKAAEIYASIVRRTQDPGLLEYMGTNLLRMRVFPIAAHGDQKVALTYTSVADKEAKLVEYVYPLKTDGKATATLESFSITATVKSEHNITNVYSPSHSITVKRKSDKELTVSFDKDQGLLDRDFQLFYATGDKDVGLTALTHRPISKDKGYFTLLVTPKVEIPKEYQVPRDLVLVLDTSGSMRGPKMDQARKALKYCLEHLGPKDRFGLINFATTVNRYEDKLLPVDDEQLTRAKKWVDDLDASGGTAINDALASALELRTTDEGRSFTVVFFTDGQPTIGESDPEKIIKNTMAKNTANTRIFTFGVGDDVNATMLDLLADKTRALSSYVRPAEDIENKVSSLYGKMSNPVLTNLKLTTTNDVRLSEIYPVDLPDLFHGGQLIVMGRYSGSGPAAIKLTGKVGMETKEFVYELTFPEKTGDEREFVEHLWARRKVGYMLDQIRANGEKKELVDEVVALAKKYGITTPYTSYLIVPDGPIHTDSTASAVPPGLGGGPGKRPEAVWEFAKRNQEKPGDLAFNRGEYAQKELEEGAKGGKDAKKLQQALETKTAYDDAFRAIRRRDGNAVQTGRLGVDLSCRMQDLRNQAQLERTALRQAYGRNCMEIGGVWIDEDFDAKMPTVVVKAQSNAYFQLLNRKPKLKEVLQLGNHLVWVTPSKTALVIDTTQGKEDLSDAEIEKMFVAMK
jgi:Ca-activated chloride channel family protein